MTSSDDTPERARARIEASFERMGFMETMGAKLARIDLGAVDIELPFATTLTQQHGFFHGGATATIADTAAGYAALTLFPPTSTVLTVEFKINLMAPAKGERLIARGRVRKSGRTITLSEATVVAVDGGVETEVATGLVTLLRIDGRPDTPEFTAGGGGA